jgi:hypothetical protein
MVEKSERGWARNEKGCDIGYAPVASSCEEANNVDTCTVTALDVITAFAVPNLNCSSQSQSIFSGLAATRVASFRLSPSLLRTGNDLFLPTLSTVDATHIKVLLHACQRSFRENRKISVNGLWKRGTNRYLTALQLLPRNSRR